MKISVECESGHFVVEVLGGLVGNDPLLTLVSDIVHEAIRKLGFSSFVLDLTGVDAIDEAGNRSLGWIATNLIRNHQGRLAIAVGPRVAPFGESLTGDLLKASFCTDRQSALEALTTVVA